MVDHRAGESAAQSARAVGAGLGERSVRALVVGDDLVAGRVVGLDEDGVTGCAGAEVRAGPRSEVRAGRARTGV